MTELRALRTVQKAALRFGRRSLRGPGAGRRTHWWKLRLSCGHVVERRVRYRPLLGHPHTWTRQRAATDVLPAPDRARCDQCIALFPPAPPKLSDPAAMLPLFDRTTPADPSRP